MINKLHWVLLDIDEQAHQPHAAWSFKVVSLKEPFTDVGNVSPPLQAALPVFVIPQLHDSEVSGMENWVCWQVGPKTQD